MKNKVKKRVLNNFGFKLLSVLFAVVLWIVVMNISDAIITKQIDDIPVEELNGDVLEELDQIYDVSSGDTVDIIVKGRRSVVSDLTARDFKATADLSTMSITNSVQIYVTPRNSAIADDISITYVNNTMKLSLEEKVTAQFPVKVKTTGNPAEDYAVGKTQATPNIITVEGPKSTVDKITEVAATVAVDNQNMDFTSLADIVLYDAYGEIVKSDKLTVSDYEVSVDVAIYPVKEVDVVVEVKGIPEDGYGVAEVIYQPQTVMIAGLQEDLDYIDIIEIDDIYVSGISEDLQTTIDLKEYIDDEIVIVGSDLEIVVTVKIEELIEKKLVPTDKQITLNNKNSEYKYKVIPSADFRVVVSGVSGVIEEITVEDIDLYIDCTNLSIGEHSHVDVKYAKLDGLDYEILGSVRVEVTD